MAWFKNKTQEKNIELPVKKSYKIEKMDKKVSNDNKSQSNNNEINHLDKNNINKNMSASQSQAGQFGYDVELYDVWDTTSKRLPIIGANRVVIGDGDNAYLYNEKLGFKEPFPENSEEFKDYKIEELKINILNIENNIKKVYSGKSDSSLKDLKKKLRIYKNYKRSLELQGNGSYMIFNTNGRPMFMFDRVGNLKIPLFKNSDRNLIYTPTEIKTNIVYQLKKENEEKNGEERVIKFSTYGLIIILLLGVCFMFYMGYKMMHLPLDVTNLLSNTANALAHVTKDLNNITSNINNITLNSVNPNLTINPATNIINGR